jgi:hypothetical protein
MIMMIVIENGLLNKFFILEYLNITRCLESISTSCPGALSSVLIPTFIIDHKKNKEHNNSETATISIVQQNNIISSDKYKVDKLFENDQMRDLYNRNKKLDYWTDRIHKDLDEYDKKDVLKFLEIMQEKDQSILIILAVLV